LAHFLIDHARRRFMHSRLPNPPQTLERDSDARNSSIISTQRMIAPSGTTRRKSEPRQNSQKSGTSITHSKWSRSGASRCARVSTIKQHSRTTITILPSCVPQLTSFRNSSIHR
jgi:hypothetical protein